MAKKDVQKNIAMTKKDPHKIILSRHVTEKAMMLQSLKEAKSNRSLARCESPKYVFIVDRKANKKEIAQAVEEIYSAQGVKVRGVNTIQVKAKPTRSTRRGSVRGYKSAFKKAIVTLDKDNNLDNV